MKKFSPMIALTLLAGCVALSPSTTYAQDDKQAEFERVWYDTCYVKKDNEKCYQQSKELVEKYPKSTYADAGKKNIKAYEQNKAWEKFQAALDAFYKQPPQDAAKLDALFAAGDGFIQVDPDPQSPFHLFVLGQMGLAGHQASLTRIYQNLDKVKGYVERAMKAYESSQPSEKTKKDFDSYVTPLKDLLMANGNQFLGFRLIETKGDQEQALAHLTQATRVKSKDGVGWKDPNNYWLRSTIFGNQYEALKAEYDKLTDDEKNSDKGKEVRKKVNDLLDTKLIPEFARVLATATKPETKPLYDAAKSQFDAFWKYRTDAPEKATDYVKNYAADPTINSVPIPAKADTADNSAAPTAPAPGASNVNLASGGSAAAPGANGNSASNGNGSKSAPAKSKTTAKSRKRRG